MKKNFTLVTTLSILNLLTAGCANSAVKTERAPSEAKAAIYEFESDANGFNTKNFFYDNGQEVVAFDTQFTPELAKKSIDFLRSKTQNPITYVVVTHPNPDKFNGMRVFQAEGAKVVMSDQTASSLQTVQDYKKYYFVKVAKMFTDETYPKLGTPDVIFHQSRNLVLGNGESIELTELKYAGVSSNQTVAFIPNLRALIVGDLIHSHVHAWLEGGIVNGKPTPTLQGWVLDLLELNAKFQDEKDITVYGGRGDSGELHALIQDQIEYLKIANRLVADYVQNLKSGTPDYALLQKIFEVKFVDFKLGYMIGYGAYGLAESLRNEVL